MEPNQIPKIVVSITEPEKHMIWLDINDPATYKMKAFYPSKGIWDYFYSELNMQVVQNAIIDSITEYNDDIVQPALNNKIDKVPGIPGTIPVFDADGNLVASVISTDINGVTTINGDFISLGAITANGDIKNYGGDIIIYDDNITPVEKTRLPATGGITTNGNIETTDDVFCANMIATADVLGKNMFIGTPGQAAKINLNEDGSAYFVGNITANNFTGNSSGTNTGDETSQTIINTLGYTPVNPTELSDYVKNTGNTVDVDLGTQSITAGSIVKTGATGDNLLMDDGNTIGFELSIVGGKTIVNAKVGSGSSYAIQTKTNYDDDCNVSFTPSTGTVQPTLTLASKGLYEITAKVYFNFRNITIADAANILTFVAYRRNNTATEISESASANYYTGALSGVTKSDMIELPPFMYETSYTTDEIIIRAKNSTAYTGDKLEITKVVFVATKISNNSTYTEKVTDITMFSNQTSSLSNVTLSMNVTTGKTVYIDFGDGVINSIVGNSTLVSRTSNYAINTSYKIKIYGDLDGLTDFRTASPRLIIPSLEGFSKCTGLTRFDITSTSATIQSCNINYLSNTCQYINLTCSCTPNGYIGEYNSNTAFLNLISLYIGDNNSTSLYGDLTNLSLIDTLYVYGSNNFILDLTSWNNLRIFRVAGIGAKTGSLTGKTLLQEFRCNSYNNINGTIDVTTKTNFTSYLNDSTTGNVNFDVTGYTNLSYINANSASYLSGVYTPNNISYLALYQNCTFTLDLDLVTTKTNLQTIINVSNGNCVISGDIRLFPNLTCLIPAVNDTFTRFSIANGFNNIGKINLFELPIKDENGVDCNYSAEEINNFLSQIWDNRDETDIFSRQNRSINLSSSAGTSAPDSVSGGVDGLYFKTLLQAYKSPNNGSQYATWTITTQ